MGDRHWFVLYVLVCLEVGIFLILAPWSLIWERNYFLQAYPALRPLVLDPVFRGAVSGLGIANVYLVLHEVAGRRYRTTSSSTELFPGGLRPFAHADQQDSRSTDQASSVGSTVGSRAFIAHEKRS